MRVTQLGATAREAQIKDRLFPAGIIVAQNSVVGNGLVKVPEPSHSS